ncbi:Son of sevenless 1 [Balamuthia mandrillaris]
MDVKQVAVIIGPIILRDMNATMESSGQDTEAIVNVTVVLIQHAYKIFPDMKSMVVDRIVGRDVIMSLDRCQVKSGTKERLVALLYSSGGLDYAAMHGYAPKFLLTYRAFLTPRELLQLLASKFCKVQEKEGNTKNKGKLLRICNFCKKWTEEQPYVFTDELMTEYRNFVNCIRDETLLRFMTLSIEKLNQDKDVVIVFPVPPPKSLLPKSKNLKFSNIKPLELARQMTLIDFELFKAIQPQELCEVAWTKSNKETLAPNVLKNARRFNLMVDWIKTVVLQAKSPKKREAYVLKWVEIAKRLRELNNYSGVMQVLAALGSASLARLNEVKKKESMWSDLTEMMSSAHNSKNYRAALASTNPPLIPHLGCFQTDLVFIDDGNKLMLPNGYINFGKCYLMASVIQQIQQYQQTRYNLNPVPSIRNFLDNVEPLDDDNCYKLSLKVQPRGQ